MLPSVSRTSLLRTLVINPLKTLRTFTLSTAHKDSFKVQDDKDFVEKVENSKEPVIVDFFATWCGPCKTLAPRLESIIAKKNGKVTVAKVDIDSMQDMAMKYDVKSVPVLVVFRNGKVGERLVGLQDEDKLSMWIDNVLNKK